MWELLLWMGGEDSSTPPSFWLLAAGFATRATWVGGLLLLFVIALLWCFQEKLLFYPGVPQGFETPNKNPKGLRTPTERGMPYEEIYFRTADNVKLHSWLIKQKPSSAAAQDPTIIFFHGNAGNVGFRLPNMELLYKHVGVNILIVSYRGYGFSEGFPTEAGIYKDAEAALDMLLKKHKEYNIDPTKIFLFGKSLGGAVAIDLAIKRPDQIRGVIVENTFTSLSDMVLIVFPFLRPVRRFIRIVQVILSRSNDPARAAGYAVRHCLASKASYNRLYMNNSEKVQQLQVPILFISGQKDELVPSVQMRTLFDLCSSPLKEREEVPLGGHNDTWEWAIGGKAYYEKFRLFLRRALEYHQQMLENGQAELPSSRKMGDSHESGPEKSSEEDTSHPVAPVQQRQDAAATRKIGTNDTEGRQVLPAEVEPHSELPLSLSPADAAALSMSGTKEAKPAPSAAATDIAPAVTAPDCQAIQDERHMTRGTDGILGAGPVDRATAAADAARVVTAAAAAASSTVARVAAQNQKHTETIQQVCTVENGHFVTPGNSFVNTATELIKEDVAANVTRRRGTLHNYGSSSSL